MLKTVLISLFMCSFDQTRQDLSSRITQHRNFIEMAYLKNILENFMADEIIDWSSIELLYGEKIKDFLSPSSCPYVTDVKEATFMYDLLHSRVNEHVRLFFNLKVVYKCYSQISVFRLAQVLNLSIEEAETALCQAVYSKVIFARINRPKKVIVFKPNLSPPHILNAYLERIEVLFLNIGHVATLINKEYNKAELTNKVVKA
ncbi:hypothetical protein HZS_978 [Henneguya salminicola]|nr:hypothetical protein HZS_978 [Henneguya salminicola]